MWLIRNGNYLSRGVANLHQTTEFCPLQEEFFLVCVAKIGLTWLLLPFHLLISRGSYRAEISGVILTLWRAGLHYVNSVQFSHSVMSDSLRPCGLQCARLPCPSPTPRAYSNPCPSSRWCHPTISSSVVPFSSCLQSFPASESFLMS